MSDFDQTSLYEFVEALHADIHLEDLDEATLISAKIRRSERIDAAFSIGSELNRLARFFSSQRFEREVAALKESIPKSVMDDWIVAHTDDVLGGKIEFVRRISEGATAEVWEAKSRLVDKAIAVKCLRPNKISDDTFRTALALAEIQNLFKFRHPNVVHVYEAGRLQGPHGQMGTFLVMEYLEGCTLEEWVAARRTAGIPVTEEEAATICRVIANALYSLHSFPGKGILHLDIKPSNIMVLGGPNAKADAASIRIIDFGSFGRNVSGGHVGTVEYMADERHLPNAEPNASWDIYSTGGLLCYLLTGKHPPRKDQSNPVFEWSMIRSDDLRKVCQIAMAANPSSRYPSIQQLQEDLAAWLYDYPLLHASVSPADADNRSFLRRWRDEHKRLWTRFARWGREEDAVAIGALAMVPGGTLLLIHAAVHLFWATSEPVVLAVAATSVLMGTVGTVAMMIVAWGRIASLGNRQHVVGTKTSSADGHDQIDAESSRRMRSFAPPSQKLVAGTKKLKNHVTTMMPVAGILIIFLVMWPLARFGAGSEKNTETLKIGDVAQMTAAFCILASAAVTSKLFRWLMFPALTALSLALIGALAPPSQFYDWSAVLTNHVFHGGTMILYAWIYYGTVIRRQLRGDTPLAFLNVSAAAH